MPWRPRYRTEFEARVRVSCSIPPEDYKWVAETQKPGYSGVRYQFSELLMKAIASARRHAKDKALEEELARVEAARAEAARLREATPVLPGSEM